MSWQLASFGILALALAGGFAWYERDQSDARTVALVATLAALAALGRIAFAAIPNVKPTTDIVLISGYALGGAPGFAVGAIAGLTSNFFFGQGPWTPWQMAAWGATGIIGAGLATATRGRIGRWPLAAACGIVGFGFAAIQDVGDWVTYSDHSSAQLRVYVAKGIGFDVVHAVGCVLFALAFGPALIHTIQRFARRMHVEWLPARATPLLLAIVALSAVVAGQPGIDRAGAAGTPTDYLLSVQNADGGYGASPHQPSSAAYAGWTALGLAAAGHNPLDVSHGGANLLSYIESNLGGATDPGSIERTILVAHAAGVSATSFGGQDLIARLQHDIRPNGSVSNQVNLTSFAVLALRAAGLAPSGRMLSWLVRQQDADGGFNFATRGGTSDVDDTGAALQALAGAGGNATRAMRRAVAYIGRQQNGDGGFPQEEGADSNAQSTAWALQGLIAAGVDPSGVRRGASSPIGYLDSLIAPDGHVRYSRQSDQTAVWVTGQALMALAGKTLPIAPLARAGAPATTHHSAGPSAPHHTSTAHRAAKTPPKAAPRKGKHANNPHRQRPAQTWKTPPLEALTADAAALAALAYAPVGLV
jgi:energy-coupling factor transport system substrate-specific component